MASSAASSYTAKQIKELKKIQRRENDLARIKEANNERYQKECDNLNILVPAPPESKRAVVIADDNRPYLSRDSFVQVKQDTSPGHYRPAGFGYITECNGVGGAAIYSVKYCPTYDGGRVHKDITLSDLTPCSPFDDLPPDNEKRTRNRLFTELLQHVS